MCWVYVTLICDQATILRSLKPPQTGGPDCLLKANPPGRSKPKPKDKEQTQVIEGFLARVSIGCGLAACIQCIHCAKESGLPSSNLSNEVPVFHPGWCYGGRPWKPKK